MTNFDDIPEARRETLITSVEPSSAKSSSSVTIWLLMALTVLSLGGAAIWWMRSSAATANAPNVTPAATPDSVAKSAEPNTENTANTSDTNIPNTATSTVSDQQNASDNLLGHRSYEIAEASSLVPLSTNAMVLLKPEVAQKVETMMAEARAVGISLDAISGFRTLEDQRYLFFDLKAERGQTTQTRAEVSAPPGYSEHHTGYAIDFIDLAQPATQLNASFEQTQAFRWLEENAAYYGFEMSFPKDNEQNVTYEPWHWRYVGNQESLELFYQD